MQSGSRTAAGPLHCIVPSWQTRLLVCRGRRERSEHLLCKHTNQSRRGPCCAVRLPDSAWSTADNPGAGNQCASEGQRGSTERRHTSLEARGSGEFSSLTKLLKMRADGPLSGVELGPLLGRGSYGRVYKVRRGLPGGLRYCLQHFEPCKSTLAPPTLC